MNRNFARAAFLLAISVLLLAVLIAFNWPAPSAPFAPQENLPLHSADWAYSGGTTNEAALPSNLRLPSLHQNTARFSFLFLGLLICMSTAWKTTFAGKNRLKNKRFASQCTIGHPHQAPPATN